ncbi:MAG TPA: WXG100 family type VII secretion target [Acidimicrobiales bacterium]|nr:WXG100 family type VII secretion target [Acidimicrobiales bacterium]
MAQGVVKSTPEAIQAIDGMKRTINEGLVGTISTLVRHGDTLNPENWAGANADTFYTEWPETKRALQNAIERLNGMSDSIMRVNTNIQSAGGNVPV